MSPDQKQFNNVQSASRVIIEQSFARLKGKCLCYHLLAVHQLSSDRAGLWQQTWKPFFQSRHTQTHIEVWRVERWEPARVMCHKLQHLAHQSSFTNTIHQIKYVLYFQLHPIIWLTSSYSSRQPIHRQLVYDLENNILGTRYFTWRVECHNKTI